MDTFEKKTSDNSATPKSAIDMLLTYLPYGCRDGYVATDKSLPNIPEIMAQARTVSADLFNGIKESLTTPGSNNLSRIITTTAGWCVYAGIGAVYEWDKDWPTLKRMGIYNKLTAERGIEEMDEYVLDLIGAPLSSKEGETLTGHILYMANVNAGPYIINALKEGGIMQLIEVYNSLYLYGMVIGMNRLGML